MIGGLADGGLAPMLHFKRLEGFGVEVEANVFASRVRIGARSHRDRQEHRQSLRFAGAFLAPGCGEQADRSISIVGCLPWHAA